MFIKHNSGSGRFHI